MRRHLEDKVERGDRVLAVFATQAARGDTVAQTEGTHYSGSVVYLSCP